jgi:hypothetical protein
MAFLVSLVVLLSGLLSGSAVAATPGPGWTIDAYSAPTTFSFGENARCLETAILEQAGCDSYHVTAVNAGDEATDGTPVVLKDVLPVGVTLQAIRLFWSQLPTTDLGGFCNKSESSPVEISCSLPVTAAPDDMFRLGVYVTVDSAGGEGTLHNVASISGGGAAKREVATDNLENGEEPGFGVASLSAVATGVDGAEDREASGHPYEFSTRIDMNSVTRKDASGTFKVTSVQDVRDVIFDLPVGFVGSAVAAPTCTIAQMTAQESCPRGSIVGHLLTEPDVQTQVDSPIYNLQPERGYAAEFGYVDALKASHVIYANVVPSASGYVLQASAVEVPQVGLTSVFATFYGDPNSKDGGSGKSVAMFTNPGSCGGNLVTTAYLDSWQAPGRLTGDGLPDPSDGRWVKAESVAAPMTECNLLQFEPAFALQPETQAADSPTGANIDITVPQQEQPSAHGTPPVKKTVVELPPGMTLDPSAATGLQACTPSEIGLGSNSPPTCPDASKVGTVEVQTPLLASTLPGSIYLATQNQNPFGSVVALYVVIQDPVSGILVKLAGKVELGAEGKIVGTFDELPELPFSNLKLHFFGGPNGDLATPETCGTYSTNGVFVPWSTSESEPFGAALGSSFNVTTNCVTGFAPHFAAGTVSPSAGHYSAFQLEYSRSDSDQELSGLTVSLPTGLVAKLAGVGLCSDAELAAAAGRSGREEQATPSCDASSTLGDVNVQAGAGPTPYEVAGKIYLTGPYHGAPYGLAVVVPALAGPYDFGTVVVRQALEVDPLDAHATVVSDPFPSVLKVRGADGVVDGFPLRIRKVTATIDRPDFTINPTDCHEKAIGAVGTSVDGAAVALKSRFQASDCASLGFRPRFVVSTSGKTSKAKGASLNVKLTYPQAPQGTYANIARVKVDLPKQLPSQLKTLQKACTAAQFNTNPAGCPAESKVGFATVHTPILPVPLSGPAIFVSHGNEAFPSLTMVLQGDNVTLDLVGTTFISKAGITSSTFKAVPDAPVSNFELNLPQGKYSALTANGNLCKSKLAMPTEFLAQNGAKINESTKISVSGCPRVKKAKAKKRAAKSKRKVRSRG